MPLLTHDTTISNIRDLTLSYFDKQRVLTQDGKLLGYRHSNSTTEPVLYSTVAASLTKHLYGIIDEYSEQELELIINAQSPDGLFKDPIISCPSAEIEHWWGWTHLTLHCLMVLALYNKQTKYEIRYLKQFTTNIDSCRKYLKNLNWEDKVDYTSNELQNIGVMAQFAKDHHNDTQAKLLLDVIFDEIDTHQDSSTGLYGTKFDTPQSLSTGVQAGYHFWLLYAYDNRSIRYINKIIDQLIETQNILGGYGYLLNSSACEDIDSIDPLYRFSKLTTYRQDDIQKSLERALPAILQNLNEDGGWVFRRRQELTIVHNEMKSKADESVMFYTWFRTLSLAYCLQGLQKIPSKFNYNWQMKQAPGHQFNS